METLQNKLTQCVIQDYQIDPNITPLFRVDLGDESADCYETSFRDQWMINLQESNFSPQEKHRISEVFRFVINGLTEGPKFSQYDIISVIEQIGMAPPKYFIRINLNMKNDGKQVFLVYDPKIFSTAITHPVVTSFNSLKKNSIKFYQKSINWLSSLDYQLIISDFCEINTLFYSILSFPQRKTGGWNYLIKHPLISSFEIASKIVVNISLYNELSIYAKSNSFGSRWIQGVAGGVLFTLNVMFFKEYFTGKNVEN